jgi:E3 ubiquitin-protein ligase HUWE1
MFIEILNTVSKIGCGGDSNSCTECDNSCAAVPMDTDVEGGTTQNESVPSEVGCSGKMVEAPLDAYFFH